MKKKNNYQKKYVFTYGTLKRGFVNNYFLDNAIFIDTATTCDKFQMYPCVGFGYPFVIKSEKNNRIKGEVFEIQTQEQEDRLDMLEGVPCLYIKEIIKVELESGKIIDALIYIKNEDKNTNFIDKSISLKEWDLNTLANQRKG